MPSAKKQFRFSYPVAFGVSLSLHLLIFVGLDVMGERGFFRESSLSQVVAKSLEAEREKAEPIEFQILEEPEEVPTQFVDASPDQATEEKPEETPYYSVVDAVAGDDSPEDSLDQPEIEGTQDKVLKTMDTPMPQAPSVSLPSDPIIEEPEPVETEMTEAPETDLAEDPVMETPIAELSEDPDPDAEGEAEQEVTAGESEEEAMELATLQPTVEVAKPIEQEPIDEIEVAEPRPARRPRPRTLAQAMEQQGLVGAKMKQEGGAKRYRLQSTPDLLATPFGDYDARVIQSIQQRWFSILGAMPTARNARGRVVLSFKMYADGSVRELKVEEDSVGVIQSLVCQKAVREPAPYGRWPDDMRRMIGEDFREVRFSFFYN